MHDRTDRVSKDQMRGLQSLCAGTMLVMVLIAPARAEVMDALAVRGDSVLPPCRMQRLWDPENSGWNGFGRAACIDEDVAAAHNNGDDTYIFRFDGVEWQYEALLPVDGALAIQGDVIVVGDYGNDEGGDFAGAVFVYRFDGEEWAWDALLFASDPHPWDFFGRAVDIDGDVMVIGANQHGYPGGTGAAYVFRCIDGVWTEEAKLLASDGAIGDRFGQDVAIAGDTIIVAASEREAAYWFRREGETWVEHAKLDSDPPDDGFACAIDLSGEHLLIGADADDDMGSEAGCAYYYVLDDRGDPAPTKLYASDAEEDHGFGNSVTISADAAIIGAHGYEGEYPDEELVSGWAYVFRMTDGVWDEIVKLVGDGDITSHFGLFATVAGDRAAIAATGELTGRLYLYAGMAGGDCNNNYTADGCDIFLGTSEDLNDNGIPDECECPGDFDGDWDVDTADLLFLLGAWGTPDGDVDFDGDTDTADLLALLAAWGECP
jgi:hypothetical protein